MYSIYCHTFPNGKKYIGLSKDCRKRWGKDGLHYMQQSKISRAINKYGWENVKHEILVDGLTKEQAIQKEYELIILHDTIKNGYNSAVGGEKINGTYLDAEVLEFNNAIKKAYKRYNVGDGNDITEFIDSARYDKECADMLNLFHNCICEKRIARKQRAFSSTDPLDCANWRFEMSKIININDMLAEISDKGVI